MRALLVAVAVVCGMAQAGSQVQTPTFRTETGLVTLDVSVLDRQRRPVLGLEAKDFIVLIAAYPTDAIKEGVRIWPK